MSAAGVFLALRFHLRHRVLHQAKHGIQIYRDGLPPLLIGHLVDGHIFGRPYAMVGDQNINRSKARDCRLHQFLSALRRIQIKLNSCAARLSATLADDALSRGLIFLIVENNFGAGVSVQA